MKLKNLGFCFVMLLVAEMSVCGVVPGLTTAMEKHIPEMPEVSSKRGNFTDHETKLSSSIPLANSAESGQSDSSEATPTKQEELSTHSSLPTHSANILLTKTLSYLSSSPSPSTPSKKPRQLSTKVSMSLSNLSVTTITAKKFKTPTNRTPSPKAVPTTQSTPETPAPKTATAKLPTLPTVPATNPHWSTPTMYPVPTMPAPATATATPPTLPTMPSPATATAKPSHDSKQLKRIVIILLAILTAVTGILVVLIYNKGWFSRNRYLSSNAPVYHELKDVHM